jgi:hypothetical protein
MNQAKIDRMPEKKPYDVYTMNGIKYLPHYLNQSVYVGPGYDKTNIAYSAEWLLARGAKKSEDFLWHRGTTVTIPNVLN